MSNRHDPCSECYEPFTADDWEHRHTNDDTGADVHAHCCPTCRPSNTPEPAA